MKHILSIICLTIALSSLSTIQAQDARAIEIADNVMEAIGGSDNWESTRYLQWNFFGSRKWWWDKWTGNVRVESQRDDLRIAMNIHDRTGHVFLHGIEQTETDSLSKYLERGYRMWINDSYWLVMPFKLQDPGTTLKYLGQKETLAETNAHVLELTFAEVGVTPDNKYWIYVDPTSHYVVQWDFYRSFQDETAGFQRPWTNYQQYGDIILSDGRGNRGMSELAVHKKLPKDLFVDILQSAKELVPE